MTTFAAKTQKPEIGGAKWKFSNDSSSTSVKNAAPLFGFPIQRKAQCACGGGCPNCQSKAGDLPISQPNDASEIEADAMADKVMRRSVSEFSPMETDGFSKKKINRNAQIGAEKNDGETKIRGGASENLLSGEIADREAISPAGQVFNGEVRSFFEPRFGFDFSHVKIHLDEKSAEFAEKIDARAFTIGNHISFAKGEYQPDSNDGRRLIAHELAHVVQQNTQPFLRKKLIQRDDKPPKKGTAAAAPKLELQNAKNGDPCACLIVIHNNERKARQTAQLMHRHCSYNLLLREPDDKERELGLKCIDARRSQHPKDPNECFPPEIAEQCINDEESCKQFLTDNAASTKAADIMKFLQISYFLSVKNCSNNFSLPVVALHNNDIEDTRRYLDKKDKVDVSGLKKDIDKSKKETGEDRVKELKDEIDKKFGTEEFEIEKQKFTIRKLLTDTAGKTNIFRWCASPALSKCHIGDPNNPDKIVWVTNPKDFDKLSKKDVNVALQTDPKSAVGTDAETDLSTLFPTVQEKLGIKYEKIISDAETGMVKDLEEIIKILLDFTDTAKSSERDDLEGMFRILFDLVKLHLRLNQIEWAEKGKAAIPGIRFLNIETPHKLPGIKDKDVVVGNYEFIVGVLEEVGLHCCGKDAKTAEENIKKELRGE